MKTLETKFANRFERADRRLDASERKLNVTEQKVEQLSCEVKEKRELDIYAFADQSERADYGSNLLKSNCVLITGMKSSLSQFTRLGSSDVSFQLHLRFEES